MATPNSNEFIDLIWSEFNGLWFVMNYSGHFENVNPADLGGSLINTENHTLASTITANANIYPNTTDLTNSNITYTFSLSGNDKVISNTDKDATAGTIADAIVETNPDAVAEVDTDAIAEVDTDAIAETDTTVVNETDTTVVNEPDTTVVNEPDTEN
jgi:homoserine kinase